MTVYARNWHAFLFSEYFSDTEMRLFDNLRHTGSTSCRLWSLRASFSHSQSPWTTCSQAEVLNLTNSLKLYYLYINICSRQEYETGTRHLFTYPGFWFMECNTLSFICLPISQGFSQEWIEILNVLECATLCAFNSIVNTTAIDMPSSFPVWYYI